LFELNLEKILKSLIQMLNLAGQTTPLRPDCSLHLWTFDCQQSKYPSGTLLPFDALKKLYFTSFNALINLNHTFYRISLCNFNGYWYLTAHPSLIPCYYLHKNILNKIVCRYPRTGTILLPWEGKSSW
jgi:hypothetical protein